MFGLIDVNSFYASDEKVFRPDLRYEHVAILSNNGGSVIVLSKEAKKNVKMGDP